MNFNFKNVFSFLELITVLIFAVSCSTIKAKQTSIVRGDDQLIAAINEAEDQLEEKLQKKPSLEADLVEESYGEDQNNFVEFEKDNSEKKEVDLMVKEEDALNNQSEDLSRAEPVTVRNISFKPNDIGGVLTIDAGGIFNYKERFNKKNNQLVLDIYPAILSKNFPHQFFIKNSLSTAFSSFKAYQKKESVRVIIQLRAQKFAQIQKEEGSLVIIPEEKIFVVADAGLDKTEESLETMGQETASAKSSDSSQLAKVPLNARTIEEFLANNNRFYGDPISLVFKDVGISEIIQMISEESGVNIISDESVKGRVSLKLREVPWDQALVIILRIKGLGYVRKGNVIQISSLEKLGSESKKFQKIQEIKASLEPKHIKSYSLSFAQVKDFDVKSFLTAKGTFTKDVRTNSLIVSDTKRALNRLEKVIEKLDRPPRQVLIEAKIVEVTENFAKSIGINWGFDGSLTLADSGGRDGGSIRVEPSLRVQPSLGAATGILKFTLGTLDFLGDISSTINLAESNGLAKVISSPSIVTLSGKKAFISQTGEVLSTTTTQPTSGGDPTTSVERSPVVLVLEVTPNVTATKEVLMDINLKRQFPGAEEKGTRPINSREARSSIMVKSGDTAVIGGVYQSTTSNNEDGLPVIKNIPVLGWLFKAKKVNKAKNELLMFITPRVLNNN